MRCICGCEVKEGWKFCKECGRPLGKKTEEEEPPSPAKEEALKERRHYIVTMREGGKEPYFEGGKRRLFFSLDGKEHAFTFDMARHLEIFKREMPPMLDEYHARVDLQEMEKKKPYGKTELLGHERILSYQKKWGVQEYLLRLLFNLMHGRFSYFDSKVIKMKKPQIEVIKKIPLLFSDEELSELPFSSFLHEYEYEGKVYFTGRRFLLLAESVLGKEGEKNALKVVLSYWIKPDFRNLFSLLSVSGFFINLLPPPEDERFVDIYGGSECMWKKPFAEWEKKGNVFVGEMEFCEHIVSGKSFENPGLGKFGAFINPAFHDKKSVNLRGNLVFIYAKKEEYLGNLISECAQNARPTDVCDMVAMASFAQEMELKRAAYGLGYAIPMEKFRCEV